MLDWCSLRVTEMRSSRQAVFIGRIPIRVNVETVPPARKSVDVRNDPDPACTLSENRSEKNFSGYRTARRRNEITYKRLLGAACCPQLSLRLVRYRLHGCSGPRYKGEEQK